MAGAKITSIGDVLWRAVDWHRSGRRGQSQKVAVLEQGLQSGAFSNEHPYILDESFLSNSRAPVRWEVIGEAEDQWEEEEETEEVSRPREPWAAHPPSWVEFPNFPEEPPGPPSGRSVESSFIIISKGCDCKGEGSSGSVPKFASASQQVVETEQRVRITAARKDPSPVPKQVIEAASSSGPSRIASVAQPLLPPPPKGSVTRSLVVLEQRPKGPAESQSLAPPVKAKPKTVEQALIPQYYLPEKARYLTWDRGFLRDFSTRGFVGALGVYSELQADKTY